MVWTVPTSIRDSLLPLLGRKKRYPPRFLNAFNRRVDYINFTRLSVVLIILLLLLVYLIITDLRISVSTADSSAKRFFLLLDVVFFGLTLLYHIVCALKSIQSWKLAGPLHRFLARSYVIIAVAWGAASAGIEEAVYGSSSTFTIIVLALAVIGYLPSSFLAAVYLAGTVVFVAIADAASGGGSHFLERFTYLVGLLGLSLFISRLMYVSLRSSLYSRVRFLRAHRRLAETNRKLKAIKYDMIRKEKLASLGRLSAGLAHEINNPIGFIRSNFSALRQHFAVIRPVVEQTVQSGPQAGEELPFILEDIDSIFSDSEEGFSRVSGIVRSLKEFSRVESRTERELLDLNHAVETALLIARKEYEGVAEVETDLREIPLVECAAGEVGQVLLNLIVNAAQAVKETVGAAGGADVSRGRISIRTETFDGSVRVRVSDTGPGIPPEIAANIFEPFFTTKKTGEGTGLGLSISFDIIVNRHGGSLSFTNEPSGGTTFSLELPLN